MRLVCIAAMTALCTACGAKSQLETPDNPRRADESSDSSPMKETGCAWVFAPVVSYTAGSAPAAVAIADLDGDGRADLAVNNYGGEPGGITLNTLRNQGDGSFAPWHSYPSTVSFSIASGAFISNSSPDLLVGCNLFPNDGTGSFGTPLSYAPTGACGYQDSRNNLAVADFDGDGRLDFAWALLLNGVVVYLNRGGGTFEAVVTMPNPVTPYVEGIASADFDRDGRPDLAGVSWGYGYPTYARIFDNAGAGTFAETDLAQGEHSPQVIAAGDLDGDGWADLVIDDAGTGMEVLLNREDGTFGSPTTYAFAEEVRSIAVGDLNGDGASDVLLGGYSLDDLGVFFNRGDGTFAPAIRWNVTSNPWGLALGDLNGDGHADIAVAVAGASNENGVDVFLSRCE